MFLRKFFGNSEPQEAAGKAKNGTPAGMQTMGASLQRKFAKGVQYNSKYQADYNRPTPLVSRNLAVLSCVYIWAQVI